MHGTQQALSIPWILFPWIENRLWHYSGPCTTDVMECKRSASPKCSKWSRPGGRLRRGKAWGARNWRSPVWSARWHGWSLFVTPLAGSGPNREKSRASWGFPRIPEAEQRTQWNSAAGSLWASREVWEGPHDTHRAPVPRSESGSEANGNRP